MILRTYIPQTPLSMFVEYFWYVQGYNPTHSRELTFPDGSVEVVIDLGDDTIRLFNREGSELIFGSSIVCGPHSEYFVIDTANESRVIGIHFKPGGIHPFLKDSLDKILNTHLSLDILWGSRAGEIRDELLASSLPEVMFRVLERRLLSLAFRPLEQHPAVEYALNELRRSQVAKIIEHIGMSHRRFNQMFKEEVGMAPKQLSRIYRFQEAMRLIGNGGNIAWADIAMACGYYDQAHFIKDFQSFSGINPSNYHSISGRHHNHATFPS
jgi:AraC-like DNA-binding protein